MKNNINFYSILNIPPRMVVEHNENSNNTASLHLIGIGWIHAHSNVFYDKNMHNKNSSIYWIVSLQRALVQNIEDSAGSVPMKLV